MKRLALALLCTASSALGQGDASPCYVTGHLETSAGELIVDGWTVFGDGPALDEPTGSSRSSSRVDSETGLFRLGPFSAGLVRVRASDREGRRIPPQAILARDAEDTYCVLAQKGHAPENQLLINIRCDGIPAFRLKDLDRAPVLVDADGQVLGTLKRSMTGLDDWIAEPVDCSEHVVEVRHPAFQPLRVEGLHPGPKHSLRVVGASALELSVLDQDGEPLLNYSLALQYEGVGRGGSLALSTKDGPGPPGGKVTGLVPGNLTVALQAPWGQRMQVPVESLGAGETRQVEVTFFAPTDLEVLVHDAGGQPAPGVEVHYVHGELADLYIQNGISKSLPWAPARSLVTDSLGRAIVPQARPGTWTFRALVSQFAFADLVIEHGREQEASHAIALPAVGVVQGTFTADSEIDWTELSLLPRMPGDLDPNFRARKLGVRLPRVNKDGSFLIEGAPQGAVVLELYADGGGRELVLRKKAFRRIDLEVGPQGCHVVEHIEGPTQTAIALSLRLSDDSLAGVHVQAIEESGDPRDAHDLQEFTGKSLALNADGSVLIDGLRPIWPHRLLILNEEAGWLGFGREVRAIEPGETHSMRVFLDLVTHRIQLLGSDDRPLVETEVGWACRGWTSPSCRGITDGAGMLEVTLPIDSYEFFLPSRSVPARTKIRWSKRKRPGPLRLF